MVFISSIWRRGISTFIVDFIQDGSIRFGFGIKLRYIQALCKHIGEFNTGCLSALFGQPALNVSCPLACKMCDSDSNNAVPTSHPYLRYQSLAQWGHWFWVRRFRLRNTRRNNSFGPSNLLPVGLPNVNDV